MNSRQRRKVDAEKHNELNRLSNEARSLYVKKFHSIPESVRLKFFLSDRRDEKALKAWIEYFRGIK